MPIPWLSLLDAVIGLTSVARQASRRSGGHLERVTQVAAGARGEEARLVNVVVSALKEAFDRDHRRLEIEREQIESARRQTERALRLELRRQAGDRETSRLRLVTGTAVVGWLGAILVSAILADGNAITRMALGAGWLLLLGTVIAALAGQSHVARTLDPLAEGPESEHAGAVSSGAPGRAAPWLLVGGMAMVALAILVA